MREVSARTIEEGYLLLEFFNDDDYKKFLEKLRYRDVTVEELEFSCRGAGPNDRGREKHDILWEIEDRFCRDDDNGMENFERFKDKQYRLVKVTHEEIRIEDRLNY
jgi:hypothetical protein